VGAALLFGAAHVVQGWRGIGVTTVFSLSAQALVLYSGSLYLAIAWHVAYDVVAGLSYGVWEGDGVTACANPGMSRAARKELIRRRSPARILHMLDLRQDDVMLRGGHEGVGGSEPPTGASSH
jgi:hypothetical protein